jgi:hypothetical protein
MAPPSARRWGWTSRSTVTPRPATRETRHKHCGARATDARAPSIHKTQDGAAMLHWPHHGGNVRRPAKSQQKG